MNYILNFVIMTKFCNLGVYSTGVDCISFTILSHLYLLEHSSQWFCWWYLLWEQKVIHVGPLNYMSWQDANHCSGYTMNCVLCTVRPCSIFSGCWG